MPRKKTPTFDELLKPLPLNSSRRWYYELFSIFLKAIGFFSEGIRIGHRHGFDSGMIMNYVYENIPRGRFYIGEVLDRAFLNQITCKAFRAIKEIQKNMIKSYLRERDGKPTFIVDLASGKANYIYDALRETKADVRVLLRDIDETSLKESRDIAERFNLLNKASYDLGNAFDIESLKKINPKPNLVVEAGLYGIIHDDELIRRHFSELKNILNPEAILFNVQTYNPQIELISRVLKNRRGERCIWRLRPVDLVIGWAENGGFIKDQIIMDPYGIYAVVLMKS